MILIDSIYIHSYGGLNILRAFIKGLINSGINETKFHFLIDNRIYIENIEELKSKRLYLYENILNTPLFDTKGFSISFIKKLEELSNSIKYN